MRICYLVIFRKYTKVSLRSLFLFSLSFFFSFHIVIS